MAYKALNKTNPADLGVDRLAELLMQTVEGDAARRRRVRMALAEGRAQEAATDIRKRFASMRRARSFLSSQGQKSLVRDKADLTDMIVPASRRRRPTGHLIWATRCRSTPEIRTRFGAMAATFQCRWTKSALTMAGCMS